MATGRGAWHIFRKEILEVLRDRRAVWVAFALPLFLYPLLYSWMGTMASRRDETRNLSVGVSGADEDLFAHLEGRNLTIERAPFDPERVRSGNLVAHADFAGSQVTLYYSKTSLTSGEALRRLRLALDAYRSSRIEGRLEALGRTVAPAQIAALESVDLSSPESRGSAALAKILPFLLVLILFTGGSFAALDVIAGEKERGTLETLFVHPVARESVVRGKFLVVLAMSLAALVSNLLGILLAQGLGAILGRSGGGFGITLTALPSASVAVGALLLTAPLAVLTSGVLILISAYSRSFREAQTYLLPVTLLMLPLLLLAAAPEASLSSAVAIVPIANSALAIRELLEGRLTAGSLLVVTASSVIYAGLVLRSAQAMLLREDLALGVEEPQASASLDVRARRAKLFACGVLGVIYFAGSALQSWNLLFGLAATLWGLVLAPALIYPTLVGSPLRTTLALRAPSLRSIWLAPIIAVCLCGLNTSYMGVQDQFLPVPLELEAMYREIFLGHQTTPIVAFLLFALSPGICEELLWRGTFQGELEPGARPIRTALWVGLFFGLFHFSIYRFVPTAAVGFVLALVRQRSSSILPCMLIHTTYNALLCFAFEPFLKALEKNGYAWVPTHPVTTALALGALLICLERMRPTSVAVR